MLKDSKLVTSKHNMNDQAARNLGLNLRKSFIVQAPAGSGKTELLIQRFLAALADAQAHPEETLAITFTRKAASEMQARVLEALRLAQMQQAPSDAHKAKTYQLAQACLKKSQKLNWRILENQHRLCIMTIDALCHKINQQSENFSNPPHPTPNLFYKKVVADFINDLEQESDPNLKDCLLYFEHQKGWLMQLLQESLATRDQWLPLIFLHKEPIAANQKFIDNYWQPLILEITNIAKTNEFTVLEQCLRNLEIEHACPKAMLKNMAEILLTKTGSIRTTFTKKQGLPAAAMSKTPAEKAKLKADKAALTLLATSQHKFWQQVQFAPLIDDQSLSDTLPKLMLLLQKLIAYLKFHMQTTGATDFIEQTQLTNTILQNPIEWPHCEGIPRPGTIRHFLLDEFQDTSKAQMQLFTNLILHCDTANTNSILVVGDPMQSIYRFRQADVSLFYHVQKHGLGGIQLEALALSSNFRSNSELITYFNNLFPNIFPSKAIPNIGAIPYHKAVASNTAKSNIEFNACNDVIEQFQKIALLCAKHKTKSIGILVRSRSIANALLPYLAEFTVHEHGLKSCFAEGETQDLLAITEFLVKPHSTIACAAILRSRLIGYSLQELYLLCEHGTGSSLFEALTNQSAHPLLQKIQNKYQLIHTVLNNAVHARPGLTLSERCLSLWQALSPFANTDLISAQISWDFLNHLRTAESIEPYRTLEALHELLLGPVNICKTANINLMTIHHAKGLEFDVVILPCLEKTTAARSSQVLWWEQSQNDFLWLCNHPNQNAISPAHAYIYQLNSQREQQEQIRLLYVAMTRAKEHLYGFANTEPKSGSFAQLLWPWVNFKEQQTQAATSTPTMMLPYLNNDYQNIKSANAVLTKLIDTQAQYQIAATTFEQVQGIAWHYYLFLYFSEVKAIPEQTQLYLFELGLQNELVKEALAGIASQWPKTTEFPVLKALKSLSVYPEYSIKFKGKICIIDALCITMDTYWIIDFKTKLAPNAIDLNNWLLQTNTYKQALIAKFGINLGQIKTMIYNPINNSIWLEQKDGYVKYTGDFSFTR